MRFVDRAPEAVLAAAKSMLRRNLVEGTAGNISARQEDGTIVITPSSVDYAEMVLEDLVVIDLDGATLHAVEGRAPSRPSPSPAWPSMKPSSIIVSRRNVS